MVVGVTHFLCDNCVKCYVIKQPLPLGDGVVVDVFGDFGNHGVAEFILHIGEHLRGVEGLESSVGLVETLLGVDVVGEVHLDADSEFGLGGVGVGRDSHGGDVVAYDFAFQFEVAAFAEHLQARLALEEVAYAFREVVAQGGVDHCRVVGEVGDGDTSGGGVVDVGSVELDTHCAGR